MVLAILFFGSLLGAIGFAFGGLLGAAVDAVIIRSGPHIALAGGTVGLTAGAALGIDAGTGYIVRWIFSHEARTPRWPSVMRPVVRVGGGAVVGARRG